MWKFWKRKSPDISRATYNCERDKHHEVHHPIPEKGICEVRCEICGKLLYKHNLGRLDKPIWWEGIRVD